MPDREFVEVLFERVRIPIHTQWLHPYLHLCFPEYAHKSMCVFVGSKRRSRRELSRCIESGRPSSSEITLLSDSLYLCVSLLVEDVHNVSSNLLAMPEEVFMSKF